MIPDIIQNRLFQEIGKSPTVLLQYLLQDRLDLYMAKKRLVKIDGLTMIYETSPRIKEKIGMPTRTQQRAFKALIDLDLIEIYHQPIERCDAPRKIIIHDDVYSGLLMDLFDREQIRRYGDRYIRPFLISVPLWHAKKKRTHARNRTRTNSLSGQSGTQSKERIHSHTRMNEFSPRKQNMDDRQIERSSSFVKLPIETPTFGTDVMEICSMVYKFETYPSDWNNLKLSDFSFFGIDTDTLTQDQIDYNTYFFVVNGGNIDRGGFEGFCLEPIILLDKAPNNRTLIPIRGINLNGEKFEGYTLPEFIPWRYGDSISELGVRDLVDKYEDEFKDTPYYKIDGYAMFDLPDNIDQALYKWRLWRRKNMVAYRKYQEHLTKLAEGIDA